MVRFLVLPKRPQFAESLTEQLGTELVRALNYYERWIAAFANSLFQKGILTPGELARKMADIEACQAS